MSERPNDLTDGKANAPGTSEPAEPRFPKNRIVALLDTPEQVEAAVAALASSGFPRSDIEIVHGAAAATALRTSTGRTGLADLVMRFSEFIGVPNDEVTIKNEYADGLKRGQLLLTVLAPSQEERERAGRILEEQGARNVKFFGETTIEWPARAD